MPDGVSAADHAAHGWSGALADRPFTPAHRKALLAKLIGVWPDEAGYYSSPTARYVAFKGDLGNSDEFIGGGDNDKLHEKRYHAHAKVRDSRKPTATVWLQLY